MRAFYYGEQCSIDIDYGSRGGVADVPLLEEPVHDLRLILPPVQVAADAARHLSLVGGATGDIADSFPSA